MFILTHTRELSGLHLTLISSSATTIEDLKFIQDRRGEIKYGNHYMISLPDAVEHTMNELNSFFNLQISEIDNTFEVGATMNDKMTTQAFHISNELSIDNDQDSSIMTKIHKVLDFQRKIPLGSSQWNYLRSLNYETADKSNNKITNHTNMNSFIYFNSGENSAVISIFTRCLMCGNRSVTDSVFSCLSSLASLKTSTDIQRKRNPNFADIQSASVGILTFTSASAAISTIQRCISTSLAKMLQWLHR